MGWWKMDADIAQRTDLTASAKLVLACIRDFQGANASAWPGIRTVAKSCGMGTNTVLRAIELLVEKGALRAVRSGGVGKRNSYSVAESAAKMETVSPVTTVSKMETPCLQNGSASVSKMETEPDSSRLNIQTNTPHTPQGDVDAAERIYLAYPRHVGKAKAILSIRKSLAAIAGRPDAPADPVAWLTARVEAYAAAVATWPAGDRQYVPHPTTWFNQGRYDDDDAEWRRGGGNAARVHGGNGSVYGRIDFGG